MTLKLELPKELEVALTIEAQQEGLTLEDYALRLLAKRSLASVESGADLVAYWQATGVIGSSTAVDDSATHARRLRESVENRYADE